MRRSLQSHFSLVGDHGTAWEQLPSGSNYLHYDSNSEDRKTMLKFMEYLHSLSGSGNAYEDIDSFQYFNVSTFF